LPSLASIVAEELDIGSVCVEMAPVTEDFMQRASDGATYFATWGSDSSRDMDRKMRKAAATARALLMQAAAKQWRMPANECSAELGVVRHTDGRTSTYADLAPIAAALPCRRTSSRSRAPTGNA
jgi:isoquinoline 1-oxidoreductase beta subunit